MRKVSVKNMYYDMDNKIWVYRPIWLRILNPILRHIQFYTNCPLVIGCYCTSVVINGVTYLASIGKFTICRSMFTGNLSKNVLSVKYMVENNIDPYNITSNGGTENGN